MKWLEDDYGPPGSYEQEGEADSARAAMAEVDSLRHPSTAAAQGSTRRAARSPTPRHVGRYGYEHTDRGVFQEQSAKQAPPKKKSLGSRAPLQHAVDLTEGFRLVSQRRSLLAPLARDAAFDRCAELRWNVRAAHATEPIRSGAPF